MLLQERTRKGMYILVRNSIILLLEAGGSQPLSPFAPFLFLPLPLSLPSLLFSVSAPAVGLKKLAATRMWEASLDLCLAPFDRR